MLINTSLGTLLIDPDNDNKIFDLTIEATQYIDAVLTIEFMETTQEQRDFFQKAERDAKQECFNANIDKYISLGYYSLSALEADNPITDKYRYIALSVQDKSGQLQTAASVLIGGIDEKRQLLEYQTEFEIDVSNILEVMRKLIQSKMDLSFAKLEREK